MDSRELQKWWDAMKEAGRPVARGEVADAVTDAHDEPDEFDTYAELRDEMRRDDA
jgi:hypothetical protein